VIQKDEVVWEGNERDRGEMKVNGSCAILDQGGDKEADYTQTSTGSSSTGWDREIPSIHFTPENPTGICQRRATKRN